MRAAVILGSIGLILAMPGAGPAAARDRGEVAETPAGTEAVERGLYFLARSQAADGSIGSSPESTSLAVMAFLARGYTPGLPPWGDVLNRGIDYVVSSVALIRTQTGLLIPAIMLTDVSGMVDPERQVRVGAVLPQVLRNVLAAQDAPTGGRTVQTGGGGDVAVAGWTVLALRAARRNGAPVPEASIERAVQGILRCRTQEGGFADRPGGPPGVTSTGISLLALELAGHHRDDVTLDAGRYLAERFRKGDAPAGESRYEALFASANGLCQLGGREWAAFAPVPAAALLRLQTANGSWPPTRGEPNAARSTSLAILALSVSGRQLPSCQR